VLADGFGADLRLALAHEHLGGEQAPRALAGGAVFEEFRRVAARLDAWHDGGRAGQRPPGRLRAYPDPKLPAFTRTWAALPYRLIYDPDGRPSAMRAAGTF
jgi:hypothetical protein